MALTPVPQKTGAGTSAGPTGAGISTTGGADREGTDARQAKQEPPAPSQQPPEVAPRAMRSSLPPTAHPPPNTAAASSDEAARVLGRAIASRTTGSLCFASPDAERRVVLREGDVVTAASSADDESLLAFLGVRGELPRETVRRLAGRFPAHGRHGGAALVAHGYLRQDQLWPVLRAHAEWLMGRMMQATSGTIGIEAEPPRRLSGEPSVFGGSTGAEVFVEVLRRIVSPDEALECMGGIGARIGDGTAGSLLSECALNAAELEIVRQAPGRTVRQVIDEAPDTDIATVLYALSLLGVIEPLRAIGTSPNGAGDGAAQEADALDAEAIRARVRARMQLVDDGDYFAVLGVARNATGYEVRRAFLELRREFDPSRILTPEVADLADDVRKIVTVLKEAYEILRDAPRRERYRRAIEAMPGT
jgi:hypothetical protein